MVVSAGFGETGPSGEASQVRILASARRHDVRVVGPNCIGVINTDPSVRLNATFARNTPTPGHLAVASQSGAVGIAILDSAARSGVGISTFVSLGNKIDVSTNDLLSYWYDDVATQAVALYVESFGNPRRFTWLARACRPGSRSWLSRADGQPVVAVRARHTRPPRRLPTWPSIPCSGRQVCCAWKPWASCSMPLGYLPNSPYRLEIDSPSSAMPGA